MSDVVIQVENLSKQYRLGTVGTGALAHDLNRWWCRLRGKPDPYLKVTQTNDRAHKGDSEYVWALRDISFEVKRGEVLGIIGRNGAGKSTLLKILSRITAPTTGEVRIKGRVGSLLEVGTGFHPELTGRENIFLNGAILGMTKAEIRGKLDEIVDFSGCERYLDTPVKRYSSGMMVRLGFAVAAHLEPEILIVDEVLAVGDAEFQKKCLGKMKDVAEHGRTVLFVSHNMAAVGALCPRVVALLDGALVEDGHGHSVIARYIDGSDTTRGQRLGGGGEVELMGVRAEYSHVANGKCGISVELHLRVNDSVENLYVDADVENSQGVRILQFIPEQSCAAATDICGRPLWVASFHAECTHLAPGEYVGNVYVHSSRCGLLLHQAGFRLFRVMSRNEVPESALPTFKAVLAPDYSFSMAPAQGRQIATSSSLEKDARAVGKNTLQGPRIKQK